MHAGGIFGFFVVTPDGRGRGCDDSTLLLAARRCRKKIRALFISLTLLWRLFAIVSNVASSLLRTKSRCQSGVPLSLSLSLSNLPTLIAVEVAAIVLDTSAAAHRGSAHHVTTSNNASIIRAREETKKLSGVSVYVCAPSPARVQVTG